MYIKIKSTHTKESLIQELETKLKTTLEGLAAATKGNLNNLQLHMSNKTHESFQEIKDKFNSYSFNLVVDLDDEMENTLNPKVKYFTLKWIWKVPALKRSYAGRISEKRF